MEDKNQILGKIEISVVKNLPKEVALRVHEVLSYLENSYIDSTLSEQNLLGDFKVVINILDIGDISVTQMKRILDILLKNLKDTTNSYKLVDKDKEFLLPDELGECLDWFIIEK